MANTTSIYDVIAYHAAAQPDKRACHDLGTGRTVTYAELNARIDRCAFLLTDLLGGSRGERVASLARNTIDLVVLQWASMRTGSIYQPLNWRLTAAELSILIEDGGPKLLFHDADFAESAAAMRSEDLKILSMAALDEALQRPAPPGTQSFTPSDANMPTTLLYTSGTTGKPKGVIISEHNALFNGVNFSLAAKVDNSSVFLCDMPMFHTAGLFAVTRTTLFKGGTLLISPQFTAAETLRRFSDPALGITHYFCAPQMAQMMRQEPGFAEADLSRLKAICTGGAPVAPAVMLPWFDDGIQMIDSYGMSEAGTVLGMPVGDIDLLRRKLGSAGLPALALEIRLLDRDGSSVADGEVGEIWLRGPNITQGYWGQPEATAAAFSDGWLKTGDAARRDADGFYYMVDRWKDMFISGGENVYPGEVEAALLEMDGLVEAAVIGVPDTRWGECGVAYVVTAAHAVLSIEDVFAHCAGRLARYKIPKSVRIVQTLPRTAAGKLQKNVLKRQWEAERPDMSA